MENNFDQKRNNSDIDLEKEQKNKHAALWSGMIFFFILISFLWFVNFKNIFSFWKNEKKETFNIEKFTQEFNSGFKKTSGRIDNFETVTASTAQEIDNEKYEKRQETIFQE